MSATNPAACAAVALKIMLPYLMIVLPELPYRSSGLAELVARGGARHRRDDDCVHGPVVRVDVATRRVVLDADRRDVAPRRAGGHGHVASVRRVRVPFGDFV